MVKNPIILNTIAKTLNAGGSAIVSAFDASAGIFNCTMSALSPGEKTKLRNRIKSFEKKIESLNGEIGKETSKYPDPVTAFESESVIAVLGNIKELNNEIEMMKQRIVEIDKIKGEQSKQGAPKTSHDSGAVASFFIHSISSSIKNFMPGEKASFERMIAEHEKKIQNLYCEIAKETAKHLDPAAAIASAAVIGIIAKINELKAEIVTLKHRIVEIAEGKKAEKAQSKVKSNESMEKTGSVDYEIQGVTQAAADDFITVKAGDVSPAAEYSASIEDDNNETSGCGKSEQSDFSIIGYTRTKPCLIPTPTLQPPTRADIETAIRDLQADSTRADRISEILEEHASSTVVLAVAEVVPAPQVTGTDTASMTAVDDMSFEIDTEAQESAAVTDVAGSEAVVTSLQEDAVSVPLAAEEDLSVAMAANDEINERAEESNIEEVPLPDHGETKSASVHKADAEKVGWNDTKTTLDEFSSIRTRSHTATFAAVSELQPAIPAPDLKPEAIATNESEPVFRTRVHRNEFFSTAAGPTEITAEEEVVDSVGEELASNEADVTQRNAETETTSHQKVSVEKEFVKKRTSPRSEAVSGSTRKSNPKMNR